MPTKGCKHPENIQRWGKWTASLTKGVEHRFKRCACGHITASQQRKAE